MALGGLALVVAAVADVGTTWAILVGGGGETNGLVATIAPSPVSFGALKLATLLALVPWLWLLAQVRRWLPAAALAMLAVGHLPIIANNAIVIAQLRGM